MDFKQEIVSFADNLKTQRDDLLLKMHLASLDIKDEWKYLESRWEQFSGKLGEFRDESKEITTEMRQAILMIGEELSAAYRRIVERLESQE